MYIFKYAWLNLKGSWAKNLLIGIIVAVISLSACIALSISDAAKTTRESELQKLSVSANIRVDRGYVMEQMRENNGIDQEEAQEALSELSGLTLEEHQTYSEAESVDNFFYTQTVYLDGNDDLEPIGDSDENDMSGMMQMGGPGMLGMGMDNSMQKTGEFTVIGFNCDEAMEDFQDGTKKIQDGKVFDPNTSEYECIISENLATFNSVKVGDAITLQRPDDEDKNVEVKVVGTYSTQTDASYNTTQEDPDNEILVSSALLTDMVEKLNDGAEDDEVIEQVVTGVYSFDNAKGYYKFEKEAKELGLDDKYTIVSNDIAAYEASLVPLDSLKKFALILLAVILVVGVIVIIFLNAINVNARKKEIGILAAMGMSKGGVIKQYIIEIFIVMLIFTSVGTAIGAVVSGPLTDSLLKSQVEMQESEDKETKQNFGREMQMMSPGEKPVGGDVEGEVEYVTDISYNTDLGVILQLIGMAIVLALLASIMSIAFILRCEPSKILSSSD